VRAKPFFSLKYQVLIALVLALGISFSTFYLTARGVIVADKKLLIRDLNLALMDGTYGAVTKSIVQRATELVQVVASGQIDKAPSRETMKEFFASFQQPIGKEVFRVVFFKKGKSEKYERYCEYTNFELLKERTYTPDFFSNLDTLHPMDPSSTQEEEEGIQLRNYSGNVETSAGAKPFFGVTLIIPAREKEQEQGKAEGKKGEKEEKSSAWLARVDLDQNFLVRALQGSDLSEIFLIQQDGTLLSHSEPERLLASGTFAHPLVSNLQEVTRQSESLEVKIGNENYMASVREAGFPGLYMVSQIPDSEIFRSMRKLFRTTLLCASLILYAAFIASLFFANRFTADMKRLAYAAKEIGKGNFHIRLRSRKNNKVADEVSQLSRGFEVMADEIQNLILETAEKSRMENELITVSLLQSTVLIAPEVQSPELEVSNCYIPATECSGDFLDGFVVGRKLYFAVADATGHGASAALVTGVAKSCLLTLRLMNEGEIPNPDTVLSSLNKVLFSACKGKLLMTMCLIRLDLDTGEIVHSNGYEYFFNAFASIW
jgi:HAMP domain-containing protein